MDLRSSQVYSDVLRDDPYRSALSARDTYGLSKPPVFVYDPYASELDQLDKTLFLERRMRIQESIINRHKTEAERVKDKDKNGKVLSKNLSSNDIRSGKKTYSGMFNNKQSNTGSNNGNDLATDGKMWLPKEAPVQIQGNGLDYPVVETLDTARGKARYALVRINSTGSSQMPQMYVESVHSMGLLKRNSIGSNVDTDQSVYSKQQILKTQAVDPNNFIGPDNQAILEKVNGDGEFRPFDLMKGDMQGDKAIKKLTKKTSKITLDDLNEEEIKKNPLTSRKTRQSLKTSSTENGLDKIGRKDLDYNRRDSRHPSRDTNQTGSRKGSIITSRQSSKHSQATGSTDTPLSLNTIDSFNGSLSPTHKRGRHKKLRKYKNITEGTHPSNANTKEVSEAQIPVTKNVIKQTPSMEAQETKTNTREKLKMSQKNTKLNEAKAKNQEGRQTPPKSQKKLVSSVTKTNDSSLKDGGKVYNTHDIDKNKNKVVNNENKGYAAKHRGLRKTDSFKMMGNSSHFFGYISAEQEVKKPKSILKKPKSDPERPDTA